jgi:hypothetical protein
MQDKFIHQRSSSAQPPNSVQPMMELKLKATSFSADSDTSHSCVATNNTDKVT